MKYTAYNILTINGNKYSGDAILRYCSNSLNENTRQIGIFLKEWMNADPFIEVRTSGSTGHPKIISVEKNQMLQSAAMTAEYFDFRKGQTALHCLPMNYIAGKMMVVRALFSQLNLFCIQPDNFPIDAVAANQIIHFAPLVPMQLNGIKNTKGIRRILLGGSPIPPSLEENFQQLKAAIYHGYGMTETLSHVAIRRVNGENRSEVYRALEGISFHLDERSCLIINAPFLNNPVCTNDIVDLVSKHEFIWKGRADLVVNSGGIKLFPEEIEKKLAPFISERFFLAGLPDKYLGEKLCLFIEGAAYDQERVKSLLLKISGYGNRFEKPRDVFFIKQFITTESGKIKREATVQKLKREESW